MGCAASTSSGQAASESGAAAATATNAATAATSAASVHPATIFYEHHLVRREAPGTLSWDDAVAHATAIGQGSRLPLHEEVRNYIVMNGTPSLFAKDMWWPVSDAPNAWVSVGNCDTPSRLGNRHDALFGPPGWGTTREFADYRTTMGVMVRSALTLIITKTPGTLAWGAAVEHAEAAGHGSRLPTHEELLKFIADRGQQPLFDADMWWPVLDFPNAWVSVGNADPPRQLGKRHERLGGPPRWGGTSEYCACRTSMGVLVRICRFSRHACTMHSHSYTLFWNHFTDQLCFETFPECSTSLTRTEH
jgi:hypothetical protein